MMFTVTKSGGANFSSRDFNPDLLHLSILAQILKVIPVLESSLDSVFNDVEYWRNITGGFMKKLFYIIHVE